jgi:hypothetical protein
MTKVRASNESKAERTSFCGFAISAEAGKGEQERNIHEMFLFQAVPSLTISTSFPLRWQPHIACT